MLNDLLKERVKRVYTIGAAAEKIESQARGSEIVSELTHWKPAVKRASEAAVSGDIVLLAPACASFDQFDSYEHRGECSRTWCGNWPRASRIASSVGSVPGGANNGQTRQRR